MLVRRLFVTLAVLSVACGPKTEPERPRGEPPRPEDSVALFEVRAIAEMCAEKANQDPISGYMTAADPSSARRESEAGGWLIDLAEKDPYLGRLPPPGPPRRYSVRVDVAKRSCEPLAPSLTP